jgi:hypothetical protein
MMLHLDNGQNNGSNNDSLTQTSLLAVITSKFVPLVFRVGSIMAFLIGIAACLLYIKQDNLLVCTMYAE